MSKRKVSVENKIYAVNLYLDGKESQQRIAHMFDVSLASVQQWIRNYESMGANAFTLKGNKVLIEVRSFKIIEVPADPPYPSSIDVLEDPPLSTVVQFWYEY